MTRKTREEMKVIAQQQLTERNLVAEQAAHIAKLKSLISRMLPYLDGASETQDDLNLLAEAKKAVTK
jgi:hypothetical protein